MRRAGSRSWAPDLLAAGLAMGAFLLITPNSAPRFYWLTYPLIAVVWFWSIPTLALVDFPRNPYMRLISDLRPLSGQEDVDDSEVASLSKNS